MKKVIRTMKRGGGKGGKSQKTHKIKSIEEYSKLSEEKQTQSTKRLIKKREKYEKRKAKKKPQGILKKMWYRITGKTKKQENAAKKLYNVNKLLEETKQYNNSQEKTVKNIEAQATQKATQNQIKSLQTQLATLQKTNATIKSSTTPSSTTPSSTTTSSKPQSSKTQSYQDIKTRIPTKSKLGTYFSNRGKEAKRTKRNVAHGWQGVKNKFGKWGRSIKKKTPKISLPTFIKTRKTKSKKTLKTTFGYNHNKAQELIAKHDTFSTQIKQIESTYPYDKKSPDYLAKQAKVQLLESKQKNLEGQLRYTTKDISKTNTNFIKNNGKFNIEALKTNITGKKDIYEFNQKRTKENILQNIIQKRQEIEKLKTNNKPINKKTLKTAQKDLQKLVKQRTKIEKSNTISKLNARSKMKSSTIFGKKLGNMGDKLGASLSFKSSLIRKNTLSNPDKKAVLKKYTSKEKLEKAKKIEEDVVNMFKNKNINIDINNYEFKNEHLNALKSSPDRKLFKQFLNLQEHKKKLNKIMYGNTTSKNTINKLTNKNKYNELVTKLQNSKITFTRNDLNKLQDFQSRLNFSPNKDLQKLISLKEDELDGYITLAPP